VVMRDAQIHCFCFGCKVLNIFIIFPNVGTELFFTFIVFTYFFSMKLTNFMDAMLLYTYVVFSYIFWLSCD
jgi:hypothetical protein